MNTKRRLKNTMVIITSIIIYYLLCNYTCLINNGLLGQLITILGWSWLSLGQWFILVLINDWK